MAVSSRVALRQGTIEPVVVEVDDELDILTALPVGTTFNVYDDAGNPMITNGVPTLLGMKAVCLIDTTTSGGWPVGVYDLYLRFTSAPEIPRLGPTRIHVDP